MTLELIHCASCSSNPLCAIKSDCNLIVLKTIYCKGDNLAWTVSAQLVEKETLEVLQLRRQHWPKSCWNTAHCTPALPPCTGHQGNGPSVGDRRCGNTQAPFWRWKTHCTGAVQQEGSAERTEGSTHNWTQGHQLPGGGYAVTGSFKGRNSSGTQWGDAEREI